MKGDSHYARGFTWLLYGIGTLFFAGTALTIDPLSPPGFRTPEAAYLFLPALALLTLVVAMLRSWEVRFAWRATWILCILLFLWFPFGTLASWSWFHSLSRAERPVP